MIPMGKPQLKPPRIHRREEWNAADPTRVQNHKPVRIVLHHSWRPTAKAWGGGDTVHAIQRYHMQTQRWADIGYHYLVGPDGTIWQGRLPNVVGSHCGGTPPAGTRRVFGNTGSLGICCVGDYDTEQPSQDLIVATTSLIVWLQDTWNIEPAELYGHCECWTTPPKTCPGRNLFTSFLGETRWKAIPWGKR